MKYTIKIKVRKYSEFLLIQKHLLYDQNNNNFKQDFRCFEQQTNKISLYGIKLNMNSWNATENIEKETIDILIYM